MEMGIFLNSLNSFISCSSNCVTEPGYTCGGGSPTGPDTCEGSDFITPSLANCEVYAALFYSTCSEAGS